MTKLHAAIVGFDITPEIHPEYGAWGTTPQLTKIDMPLLARCVALRQDKQLLIWFGSDLCGNSVPETDLLRSEVADALDLERQQVIWSTSQTHSSPTLPGSNVPGGSGITVRGTYDPAYCAAQRQKLIDKYINAAREALDQLQPVNVLAGYGYCDSMSYNTRFPMPAGGVKFSRHHGEGLQSGKFVDKTLGLVRFDSTEGRPLGAIFNFCAHPATMINDIYISPDWVGTAREIIEDRIDGCPAMFVQGFCGDVNCNHMFGTPQLARRNGQRLGEAAAQAMGRLVPVRTEPLAFAFDNSPLLCQPMYTHDQIDEELDARRAFIEELDLDPQATWCCGINFPEQITPEQRMAGVQIQIDYLEEARRMLDANELARQTLDLPLGAVRIGDIGAALSAGENFTLTGHQIRSRSPFPITLICGDTNGMFGYIGDDDEIDRGGSETDAYWKMLYIDGFRLPPAKGTVDRIISTSVRLLEDVQQGT